ncbi:helix-turn-helix domain-containing protein [Aquabacterium parvum]|uniref:helix-turn-helix domain-containing protein n=1 Tax=Aquabacterium parvum TaxID=70584 RepID=UPI000718C401|nr:helix-turn-helix domain-containing protein [Aquabacterium parvum]MBU0914784.1 helix-turn-helix domain-containing protein [Gammaproteobacteria bacterium]
MQPTADAAFAAELAQLRLQAGLSRRKLAEQLGIETADVDLSEAGQRHVDVVELFRWCQVCESSLEGFAERMDRRLARATGSDRH